MPEKAEGEEEEEYDEEGGDESEEAPAIYQKTVPNIQQFWVKLLPNQD